MELVQARGLKSPAMRVIFKMCLQSLCAATEKKNTIITFLLLSSIRLAEIPALLSFYFTSLMVYGVSRKVLTLIAIDLCLIVAGQRIRLIPSMRTSYDRLASFKSPRFPLEDPDLRPICCRLSMIDCITRSCSSIHPMRQSISNERYDIPIFPHMPKSRVTRRSQVARRSQSHPFYIVIYQFPYQQ